MYSYEQTAEVGESVQVMPVELLPHFAELIAFLELTPWAGHPFQPHNPAGGLRKIAFGPNDEALATYLVLEEQRRVIVVGLLWFD